MKWNDGCQTSPKIPCRAGRRKEESYVGALMKNLYGAKFTTLEFTNKHHEPKLKNYKKIQPFVFNIKTNILFM
jgi:hypothetical protein